MSEYTVNFGPGEIVVRVGENTEMAAGFAAAAAQSAEDAEDSLEGVVLAAAAKGVYEGTAAGLADTTDGDTFYVAVGGDVTLYQNDGGSAVEIAAFPTDADLAAKVSTADLAAITGADLVGYQQDGTGSIPLTLASKAKQIVYSSEFQKSAVDGLTNNRTDLQEAIDASVGKTLFITPGEYRTDTTPISVPSNVEIWFMQGASIKMLDTSSLSGTVFQISDVENVTIWNMIVDGNQAGNPSTDPGVVYGVRIRGVSKNIRLYNPVTNNMYTDGINIVSFGAGNNPDDVYILNHRADRCRRQGMSIISGSNITVDKPIWSNIGIDEINGYAPGAGIDIEAAASVNILKNIKIIDPTTINCEVGIIVDLYYLTTGASLTNEADVTITNPTDYGSNKAFVASAMRSTGDVNTGLKRGKIKLIDPRALDTQAIPFLLGGIPGVCNIEVVRPYISNPNTNGATGIFSTVFWIAADNGPTSATTGGVHIYNPEIHADSKSVARLWNPGASGAAVADCSLIDPIYISPVLIDNTFVTSPALSATASRAFKMSDINRTCVRQMSITEDMTTYPPPHCEMNTIASRTITLPLAQSSYMAPIEVRWMPGSAGSTLTFQPKPGENIVALGAGMTKIRATAHGSVICFEQLSPGNWAIKSKSGQWEEVA